MINCLIVDDDPVMCDLLEHFCSKTPIIKNVISTESGFEAINLITQKEFDLILLDYNLDDLTGEDILKVTQGKTKVIMVTSNTEFGATSYQFENVVDFLVKPIEYSRFHTALQRVIGKEERKESKENDSIFVKDGNKLVKVHFPDILYLKAEANYTSIVTTERKILTLITMKKIESELPENFQRTHRSFIVNVDHIDSIDKNEITIGKNFVPISQKYSSDLHSRINLLN